MKKSMWILFCIIVFPIVYFFLALSTAPLGDESYRYRIEVVIDDNGVERAASGVMERRFHRLVLPLPVPGSSSSFFAGEVIPIDLGERGVILALLEGSQWAFDMLLIAQEDVGFSAIGLKKTYWPDIGDFSKPNFPRGRTLLEQFAILKDRNDPSTLEVFGFDEFERFVGKGVRLKRLTFELVSPGLQFSNFIDWLRSGARLDYLRAVPVTTGILEKFPWMDCGRNIASVRNLSPGQNPETDRVSLTCGAFWKTH